MSDAPALSLRRRMARLANSGTIATLILLLVALWVVFAITIGDRFFSVNTLQSIAFQMPELGILSLAMMLALLSGGLNLSIIATANLAGLTIAFLLTHYIPGSQGIAWVWRASAGDRGRICRCRIGRPHQRICHRLSRRFADPRNARYDDALQGPRDRPDTRQRHLRISGAHCFYRQWNGFRSAFCPDRACALCLARRAHAKCDAVRGEGLHDRFEREGDPLLRRRYPRRRPQALCTLKSARRSGGGGHVGTFQFGQRGIW